MFSSISQKFSELFKEKIKKQDLEDFLRKVRLILLEADVNLKVTTEISEKTKKNALGIKVWEGVGASDMIAKFVNDAIKETLGSTTEFNADGAKRIMLVGLQGSGKTTTAVKLASFIAEKAKTSPLLISLDYYRPAAREQLNVLCKNNKLDYFDDNSEKTNKHDAVIDTAKRAMKATSSHKIFDTAGRTSIDENMLSELVELKKLINPDEIILVIDSMIGKSAVDVAKQFHAKLELTGLIFTKTDSDAKAGAMLSIRHVLNVPIYFLCSGEKVADFDNFHPERIADRVLGMGDIVSLVEKASKIITDDNSDKLKNKAAKGQLDLFDILDQFKFLRKMGGLPFVSKFLPTEMLNSSNVSEKKIKGFEAIILSMTQKERVDPKIVMQSVTRKKRIADGSGTDQKLVHELLMMHSKLSKVAQQFAMFDKSSMMDRFKLGGAMTDVFNNRNNNN